MISTIQLIRNVGIFDSVSSCAQLPLRLFALDIIDAGTVTASNRYNTSYTYADLWGNTYQRTGRDLFDPLIFRSWLKLKVSLFNGDECIRIDQESKPCVETEEVVVLTNNMVQQVSERVVEE